MKQLIDMRVVAAEPVSPRCTLLRLAPRQSSSVAELPALQRGEAGGGLLPAAQPGQFAQVRIDGNPHAFLRRPISIHYIDEQAGELWLLVQAVGEGTRTLCNLQAGDCLNVLLPLGHGFCQDIAPGEQVLLCGGGIGVAPLLEYGKWLRQHGAEPTFLLAARTQSDLLQLAHFRRFGEVLTCTDDGSAGFHGLITRHPLLATWQWRVAVCGPMPMMRAMAQLCKQKGLVCEVSLENRMACGLGACLCCVEKTKQGNVCVCTEGPVFNIDELDI